jgi:hypothetical protein
LIFQTFTSIVADSVVVSKSYQEFPAIHRVLRGLYQI